jgi:hypothetical protein
MSSLFKYQERLISLARGFAPLLLILLFSPHALAGIRPSFWLEICSWRATHIVVATEGQKIDGVFRVLESWKGDLPVGETVRIPELAAFNSKEERTIRFWPGENDHLSKPLEVTGDRVVLFLRDANQVAAETEKGEDEEESRAVKSPSVTSRWKSANSMGDEIKVSMVWIEQGEVYGFVQRMNPGPSSLYRLNWTEAKMERQVIEILETRDAFDDSLAIADPSKRAEALQTFVSDSKFLVRDNALKEITKCGEAALPVLRRMMNDETLNDIHDQAIDAFAQAGGRQVAPELTALLEKELSFWQQTGPTLQKGWWNGNGFASIDAVEPLRNRYGKIYRALVALNALRYREGEKLVTEVRDFWRSLPQLDDKSGLDQISDECDSILKELYQ